MLTPVGSPKSIPKQKGGKPWKFHKLPKFVLITIKPTRKKNTIKAYRWIISKFCEQFGNAELIELSSDQVLNFLNSVTEGRKTQTRRIRFAHLSSFFNFIKNNFESEFQNPCDNAMLRKLFRAKVTVSWDIIDKDTVEEVIFRTTKIRNRLILELMARGGMRVSEVLKLRPKDIDEIA